MHTDLSGQKFNFLTVIQDYGKKILCHCDCGTEKIFFKTNVNSGHTKSCGCFNKSTMKKRLWIPNTKSNLTKNIICDLWTTIKTKSKQRHIEFTITPEYVQQIIDRQQGLCRFSGVKLIFPKTSYERRHGQYTASLDRIDSAEDYVEGNVQWVHKHVNFMKLSLSDEEFIEWCQLIVNFAKV